MILPYCSSTEYRRWQQTWKHSCAGFESRLTVKSSNFYPSKKVSGRGKGGVSPFDS